MAERSWESKLDSTRCPVCNHPLNDARLIACPNCGLVFGGNIHRQFQAMHHQQNVMQEAITTEIQARVQRVLQERQQERRDMVDETVEGAKKGLLKWIGGGAAFCLTIFAFIIGLGLFQIYYMVRDFASDQ